MKIAVVGTGYVGLANAVLLAQFNEVVALDVVKEKVDMVNNKQSPIDDDYIHNYLQDVSLNLRATLDKEDAYKDAEYIIIATPTDYTPETNYFNTKTIESVVEDVIKINPKATMVIKSTVPVGYTDKLKALYKIKNIFFSPEFLREGRALYDCLYPSRIIVGDGGSEVAIKFGQLLKQGAIKSSVLVKSYNTEAEAVKLFSNAYLAMRVAFFNELDSYCEMNGLSSRMIIQGMEDDPRIGKGYNNPSFGYGGYCFPKDTKQLLATFDKDEVLHNEIITAIVKSNESRKEHIVASILTRQPKVVGIYRLAMKAGSDNFRSASILDIIDGLEVFGADVIVYEPNLKDSTDYQLVNNFEHFVEMSDIIVANRMTEELYGLKGKVYSRDVFGTD